MEFVQAEYGTAGLDVTRLFEFNVRRAPDAIALISGDRQWTYRQLNLEANRLAQYLRSTRHVGPETLVGIGLPRSVDLIVAMLGVLKAGAAYVPLDLAYPFQRLASILEDARPDVLLTDSSNQALFPGWSTRVVLVPVDAAPTWKYNQDPRISVPLGAAAYVIYTSGTTGEPKGVLVERRSLANYISAAGGAYGIRPSDRVLQFSSPAFDASAEEIYVALTTGASLVLRSDSMLASVAAFFSACNRWRVTVLGLPTAYWHELTLGIASEGIALPPSIRLVIIGSERVRADTLQKWRTQAVYSTRLINTYGPTEATIAATMCDISEISGAEVPIGRAIPNVSVHVLDQDMLPVAAGLPGEIYIGGIGVARCYVGRQDLTAERFVPDSISGQPGSRLYKTGDLARILPDGNLEFIGRLDRQVKIRGLRVEIGEVEAALMKHSRVSRAAVVACEGDYGDKRLVAYVTTRSERAAIVQRELRAFLKTMLPEHMVPASFVQLDEMPVTVGGKVDYRALPQAPAPKPKSRCNKFPGLRIATAERIRSVCAEVLGEDDIDIHKTFFELGGNSLLAIRLILRIRTVIGLDLQFATIASCSVAELAAESDSQGGPLALAAQPIIPAPQGAPLPVSFAQQAIWITSQLAVQSVPYNNQLTIRFIGHLELEVLNRSLTEIVRRHEIFRTSFYSTPKGIFQRIHKPWPVNLPLVDLQSWPEHCRKAETERLIAEECRRPFDFTEFPMLRWTLLRLTAEDYFAHSGGTAFRTRRLVTGQPTA
jgi:amino acid adenylation domain-containing protein